MDEIGEIARTVAVFRNNSLERRKQKSLITDAGEEVEEENVIPEE